MVPAVRGRGHPPIPYRTSSVLTGAVIGRLFRLFLMAAGIESQARDPLPELLQLRRLLDESVRLDDVTFLDVLIPVEPDAAFESLTNLRRIVLESPEG
jgi:hypothetical protein